MDSKHIINPWKEVEGYDCFGCSPDNPLGLHMEFQEEGEDIVCHWHPGTHFQGWVHTMHGGILSTLCDETAGWVVFRKLQTSGVTTELNVRYKKPVMTTDDTITIRGHVIGQKRNLVTIGVTIQNQRGDICVTCEATYYTFPPEKAREMGFIHCRVEGE